MMPGCSKDHTRAQNDRSLLHFEPDKEKSAQFISQYVHSDKTILRHPIDVELLLLHDYIAVSRRKMFNSLVVRKRSRATSSYQPCGLCVENDFG